LVAALAALGYRESEQKNSDYEYEDYLVVYDLYAPGDQGEGFASVVKSMAVSIRKWQALVYINPQQLNTAANLANSSTAAAFDYVYDLVGTVDADEIFLGRNWQFSNHLLINAYRRAAKVCYGDSIGIYFSESYFAPSAAAVNERSNWSLRRKLKDAKSRLAAAIKPGEGLKEIDFDVGYFSLPDILGQVPPMKTRLVDKRYSLDVFQKLGSLLEEDFVSGIRDRTSDRPTIILMTSNFAEAERMTLESEIAAYKEFLKTLDYPRESVLIIKPHPRESDAKVHALRSALSDLFPASILLAEPKIFFVPFEMFLMRVFLGASSELPQDLKIVTFSTACLSPALLFNTKPVIGFGAELVSKYFHGDYASGRIKHERDLQLAIQRIAEGNQVGIKG